VFNNVYCIYAREYNILPAGGIFVESFFRRSSIMRERERERERESEREKERERKRERERGSSVRGLKEGRRKLKKPVSDSEKSNQSSILHSIAVRWFASVLFFFQPGESMRRRRRRCCFIVQFYTRPVSSLDLRLFQSGSMRITMLRRRMWRG